MNINTQLHPQRWPTSPRRGGQAHKAGMPDYHLPVALNGKHGLWIELKAEGGRPTTSQKEVHEDLKALGHDVRVCVGWQACADAVMDYYQESTTQ